jgi:5-methylcytosine-specific restriction endonuclease McrA
VVYANSAELEQGYASAATPKPKRMRGRDPSLRVRWRVLKRDRFSCAACGASPAKDQAVELHVDHVFPWSKGGETTLENLQALCQRCNLGKADV